MVHVSEYIKNRPTREPEKSNVEFVSICVKCGGKFEHSDVGAFMRDYTCVQCKQAKDYDNVRGSLKT